MNIIREIETIKNTVDLDNLVTTILEYEFGNDERIYTESYAETADRVENDNEKLAYILRVAEKRWFELEG